MARNKSRGSVKGTRRLTEHERSLVETSMRRLNPENAKLLSAAEKQRSAIVLHLAGHTYQEIADVLGYAGRQGAQQAVMKIKLRLAAQRLERRLTR
jgi:DNA-directed RNA polymerase specialized sigma24 family protein